MNPELTEEQKQKIKHDEQIMEILNKELQITKKGKRDITEQFFEDIKKLKEEFDIEDIESTNEERSIKNFMNAESSNSATSRPIAQYPQNNIHKIHQDKWDTP